MFSAVRGMFLLESSRADQERADQKEIWLHEYLSDEVVADRKELEGTADPGIERAVDAVLRGARHRAEIKQFRGRRRGNRRSTIEAEPLA